MSVLQEFLGVTPWVVITAGATWFLQAQQHRATARRSMIEGDAEIEKTRGELTVQLLSSAREEAIEARREIEGLHGQLASLRSLEQHFFHFQQALDHLDAILTAADPAARESAERVAKAFLKRMRRVMDAKGTIANEVQRVDSALAVAERLARGQGISE